MPQQMNNKPGQGKDNRESEVNIMKNNANRSIGCTVTQCEYHCGNENYCSLEKINVGTHEQNPTEVKCTDCESFKLNRSCN